MEDEEVVKKYKSHKKWKERLYKWMETKLIYPKMGETFQYVGVCEE
ncbi:MAG: hypothetical protein ACW98K_18320 [Candidatus Kariarchaeaceae archaeon]